MNPRSVYGVKMPKVRIIAVISVMLLACEITSGQLLLSEVNQQQQSQPQVEQTAEKQFAMDYNTAKKSASCLLEIRDNFLKLEPYQHTHVAEYFPQYLEKYECVQELARTTGMDRRGKGLFYNIGKRLGMTRWNRPGNRLRDWITSRLGGPARQNDFTCGELPAAECVATGFMYRCLGCCLGSEQSALESGCCNVCLFKVLLFGDDPTLGSIPVELIEQKYGVAHDRPNALPSSPASSSASVDKTSKKPPTAHSLGSFSNGPLKPMTVTKISHTEAALAANDLMLNLDGKPLTPEQIKELEEKKRREQAELEQISNIAKYLKDNYKPEYLPDVQENDPSSKHTRFNPSSFRTKKELQEVAQGVPKNAQKILVWNGSGFDAAIVEQNGKVIDYGKVLDDAEEKARQVEETYRKKQDELNKQMKELQAKEKFPQQRSIHAASDRNDPAFISWTGNGKLALPDPAGRRDRVQSASTPQKVMVWMGNGKFVEGNVEVNPSQRRSYTRPPYYYYH